MTAVRSESEKGLQAARGRNERAAASESRERAKICQSVSQRRQISRVSESGSPRDEVLRLINGAEGQN